MLSVGEKGRNLKCADCRSCFSSASLLLKHFVEHINEKNFGELPSNNATVSVVPRNHEACTLHKEKKKERKKEDNDESILEAVLKQSVQNVDDSKSSTKQEITDPTASFNSLLISKENCIRSDIDVPNKIVVEIGQRAKEKMKSCTESTLMKFDLQKRLENCVSKLVQKQSDIESANINNLDSHQYYQTVETFSEVSHVSKNGDDDFNPLKFCIVTLEENEQKGEICKTCTEKVDVVQNANFRSSKGASNRKQQMPKKIHRLREEGVNMEVSRTSCNVSLNDEQLNEKSNVTKRKYMCHVCSKAFGWSTDLKRHTLTHTGERPFKCQRCSATFTRNFLLQKHERRTHHNDLEAGRLDTTQEMCDKYSSKKGKLVHDASFELFPKKIYNIL